MITDSETHVKYPIADYAEHVDGKRRVDGVRDFLASRDISLPLGTANDSPERMTINGVGNRKNEQILHLISAEGVEVYEGSQRYLEAARAHGDDARNRNGDDDRGNPQPDLPPHGISVRGRRGGTRSSATDVRARVPHRVHRAAQHVEAGRQ